MQHSKSVWVALQHIDMGWLRLVGPLKLQVSLAEYRLFYRDLLQKSPIIWRSLLIVATPYTAKFVVLSDECLVNKLQHTTIHGNTLQRTESVSNKSPCKTLLSLCNTQQNAATSYNTQSPCRMSHAAKHCYNSSAHCYTLLHTATHCYKLQQLLHTATHCNTQSQSRGSYPAK